ncbi:MAG TPA: hypothetical protein VJV23_15470 [Candidatus Polarisedimenticolia bacterium]|nr:hypothetical protein [Candidatus Polarisedimenticolia bacterium]
MTRRAWRFAVTTAAVAAAVSSGASAGGHTWDVNEVFSNADGTIQFIELKETGGGAGETGTGGKVVSSLTKAFTMTSNVASPTSFKHILLATAGFAALPGAPTPNYIIPSNFFSVSGDTLKYSSFDTWVIPAIPTDGVNSHNRSGPATALNSPTNYAGQTGSVNANPAPAPPAVPDGSAGSTPMTVQALDATGSALSVAWDTATCTGNDEHAIVYGQGSGLPAGPGEAFTLMGSVCDLGASSPFLWDPSPVADDGSGLIWWLIVVNDGATTEGSWGRNSAGQERLGPGAGGSSGQCGVSARSLSNTCGH